ncbi:hypothetical protein PoB_000219000 [Plakobranchus ocellatus]|uniref:Uncharacterized protein n=1 Tax=Plakobranchus ocellatus TaxID=259542 RepID=A0AAV3XZ21_9GAST|nr:hypothetical protein PoB_000219000 [Plakobranchus ocellatus]
MSIKRPDVNKFMPRGENDTGQSQHLATRVAIRGWPLGQSDQSILPAAWLCLLSCEGGPRDFKIRCILSRKWNDPRGERNTVLPNEALKDVFFRRLFVVVKARRLAVRLNPFGQSEPFLGCSVLTFHADVNGRGLCSWSAPDKLIPTCMRKVNRFFPLALRHWLTQPPRESSMELGCSPRVTAANERHLHRLSIVIPRVNIGFASRLNTWLLSQVLDHFLVSREFVLGMWI